MIDILWSIDRVKFAYTMSTKRNRPVSDDSSMSESQLTEVINEALYMLPLLIRVVEDGCGRSCAFSWLTEGLIVSKLELEPVPDLVFCQTFICWALLDRPVQFREGGKPPRSIFHGHVISALIPVSSRQHIDWQVSRFC